jgi:hypothetical protein
MPKVDTMAIRNAAQELLDLHGESALLIARERADAVAKQGNQPELDIALLILSAVERLQKESAPPTTTPTNDAAGSADPAAMNVDPLNQAASTMR